MSEPRPDVLRRFVVGHLPSFSVLDSFETMDEVRAFQATLDQDALARGDYYLDDMTEGEA